MSSQHERSLHRAHRHRADAVRRLRPVGLHLRHLGPVLHAVRDHHRRLDGDFLLRLAHPEPGAQRCAAEAPPDPCRAAGPEPDPAGRLRSLQCRFRVDVVEIRECDRPLCPGDRPHPPRLCRADLADGLSVREDAHGLHPGSRHRLPRYGYPAAAGLQPRPYRRGGSGSERHHPENPRDRAHLPGDRVRRDDKHLHPTQLRSSSACPRCMASTSPA
jgi:hypothetical protein